MPVFFPHGLLGFKNIGFVMHWVEIDIKPNQSGLVKWWFVAK